MLICKNDKIVVRKILQNYLVNWYHKYLLNLGADLTEATISQKYYWPNLRDEIFTHIKVCTHFQKKQEAKLEL